MTPKPPKASTPRVDKLRQERETLGLKRRELYATNAEWPQIQAFADKLARKRAKEKAP